MGAVLLAAAPVLAQDAPLPPEAPPESAPPAAPEDHPVEVDAAAPVEVVGPAEGAATVTLAEAVAMALEENFTVQASAEQVRRARLGYSVSLSDFFPRLTPRYDRGDASTAFGVEATQRLPWTGGSFVASTSFISNPDAEAPFTRSSDLKLEIVQPLLEGFGPNAAMFDLRNSRRAREDSERGHELRRQQVALDVAQAFYEVVQQRALLAVARQSEKRSEALERASQARLEVGLVSKLDVFRAQLQAAQAQEAAVRAEAALGDALERFRFLLGRAPTDTVEPEAAVLPEELTDPLEPTEVLIERAKAHRLELLEARDRVGDARRSASLARQNLLPQLDLKVGFRSLGQGPDFGLAWRSADRGYYFGLSTSYPVRPAADAAAKVTADIQVAASLRTVREQELQIESEVRRSVRELGEIEKSVELQKKALDVAQQQHRLATLRYQRGLASNFDVVEAEEALLLARTALVGLLTRYQVARVRLLKATGSLDVQREFALGAEPAP